MPCWVVPTVAAEVWGISVQQVQARINQGSIPTKLEKGFTFVDVAPNSPVFEPARLLKLPPPPTFRIVSREEIIALIGKGAFDDEESAGDWRIGRSEATRMRKPPESLAA